MSLWIAASVADAAAFNSNGIKTLLANDLSTLPIWKANYFSVIVLDVYQEILLIVLFYIIEF